MSEHGPTPLPGLDHACEELARGRPVVVPNACPMAYLVLATSPRPLNLLKGRPADQNAGIALPRGSDWRALAEVIDLSPDDLAGVTALMHRDLLSFLLPLRAGQPYPEWVAPAVRAGQLAVFAAVWEPLGQVWERFSRLFGSSANRTGHAPATTAAEAREMFGTECLIVDGDSQRTPGCTRGSSTIMQISPDGRLHLYRSGAQDAGLDGATFVRRLEESLRS